MTSKQFSPEWCEAAAAEIERLRVEADKLLLTLEITTIERDEAREAAKWLSKEMESPSAYRRLAERYPWLEEK